jgi:hypothetical protein
MFQNNKKHAAARVKELVTSKKSSMHSDPASVCKINTNFETISNEGESRIHTCEDTCSVHSNFDNKAEQNDNQITTTSSACLNTEQESVMNNMHDNTEQTEITSSGYAVQLNDLPKTSDKQTEISTVSCSNLNQEMAVQTNAIEIPTADSKSEVVHSEISYSIPCDLESPILVPHNSTSVKSLLVDPNLSHDPVLLHTESAESDIVSPQLDTYDAKFPSSDCVSNDLVATKSNVPNTTKPETDKLRSESEIRKECVS